MKIGQVAKSADVNVETIRYYERIGFIERPPKPENGFRKYSKEIVTAVKFIKNAQKIGFSLNEIKELLSLRVDPDKDCSEVKLKALAKIEEIETKIDALNKMKRSLTQITNSCNGTGSTSKCNILNALDSKEII